MFDSSRIYPKPGPMGGRLIREVVAFFKVQKVPLPLDSPVLIAVSGGTDSVALAHLLIHFGRRIVDRSQISLIHVNHGWRGKESDEDEAFVQDLGKRWGVPVITKRLKKPEVGVGKSWEDLARDGRKTIFAKEAKRAKALIFTGHQADDLAETVIWRLCTGSAKTHGGGVAFRHGSEVRPFLRVRKWQIKKYLQEMGETHREDSTNLSERFMRSRMRSGLMPEVEKLFPKAVEHLVSLALSAQDRAIQGEESSDATKDLEVNFFSQAPGMLIQAAGLKVRRPHLELILEKLEEKKSWCGEIHLPGGWKLMREKKNSPKANKSSKSVRSRESDEKAIERWVLERI